MYHELLNLCCPSHNFSLLNFVNMAKDLMKTVRLILLYFLYFYFYKSVYVPVLSSLILCCVQNFPHWVSVFCANHWIQIVYCAFVNCFCAKPLNIRNLFLAYHFITSLL
jgi:hypothetical protein